MASVAMRGQAPADGLWSVAIDPAVLTKPGQLFDDEWLEIKRQPVFGADVIGEFTAYRERSPLVRWHYEAWDGGGYPEGIRGERIPLSARVLAVADTFDALTSDRPYREGMPPSRARLILAEGAGKQWDAAVVQALFNLLDRSPDRVPVFLCTPSPAKPVASSAEIAAA